MSATSSISRRSETKSDRHLRGNQGSFVEFSKGDVTFPHSVWLDSWTVNISLQLEVLTSLTHLRSHKQKLIKGIKTLTRWNLYYWFIPTCRRGPALTTAHCRVAVDVSLHYDGPRSQPLMTVWWHSLPPSAMDYMYTMQLYIVHVSVILLWSNTANSNNDDSLLLHTQSSQCW